MLLGSIAAQTAAVCAAAGKLVGCIGLRIVVRYTVYNNKGLVIAKQRAVTTHGNAGCATRHTAGRNNVYTRNLALQSTQRIGLRNLLHL